MEQALRRELIEEANMNVISWQPLGYQIVTNPRGDHDYQLRVYAVVEPLGEFTNDPGGSVIGYKLININDLEKYINYGLVGEWLINRVKKWY